MSVSTTSFTSTTPTSASTSIVSPSVTTASSNAVIVFGVAVSSAAVTITSVTLTGFTGTTSNVISIRNSDSFVDLFAVIAPATSVAGTIRAGLSAAADAQLSVWMLSGADQTTPCPTGDAKSATDTGAGSTINRSMKST